MCAPPAILHLVVALARQSHHSPQPSLRTADYFLFHFQISRIVISVLGETQTQHISLEVVQATGKREAFSASHTAFGAAQIRRSITCVLPLNETNSIRDVPEAAPCLEPQPGSLHSRWSIRESPVLFANPQSGRLIGLEDAAAFALVYLSLCLQPRIKMPDSAGYGGRGWRWWFWGGSSLLSAWFRPADFSSWIFISAFLLLSLSLPLSVIAPWFHVWEQIKPSKITSLETPSDLIWACSGNHKEKALSESGHDCLIELQSAPLEQEDVVMVGMCDSGAGGYSVDWWKRCVMWW